jgi:predicted SprT family Zn-dependent metalloprotease
VNLSDAKHLALSLMRLHGLEAQGWRFEFDQAIRRFGCCHWSRKLITLSAPIVRLNEVSEVRATILHEIAHALAGKKAGHGPEWKTIAVRIGDDGERCYESASVKAPPPPFIGECPNRCGKRVFATWRPSHFCQACYWKADAAGRGQGTPGFSWTPFLLAWRRNPEAFALERESIAARNPETL